jgi:hypothetical protein
MKKTIAALAACAALFVLGLSGCDAVLDPSDDGEGFFTEKGSGQLNISLPSSPSGLSGSYYVYVHAKNNVTNPESGYVARSHGSYYLSSSSYSGTPPSTKVELRTSEDSGKQWAGSGNYYAYLVGYSSSSSLSNDNILVSNSVSFSHGNATISGTTGLRQASILTINNASGLSSGTYNIYLHASGDVTNPQSSPVARGSFSSSSSQPVALYSGSGSGSSSRWTGEGSFCVYLVYSSGKIETTQASFSDGVGTINFNAFTQQDSTLMITGITSTSLPSGTYTVYLNSETTSPSISPVANGSISSYASSEIVVTMPLYSGTGSSSRWTPGSGSSYYVYFVNSSNQVVARSENSVSFQSNGKGNISASDLVRASTLTLTNISTSAYSSGSFTIGLTYTVYIHGSGDASVKDSDFTPLASGSFSASSSNTTQTVVLSSGQWTGSGNYYVYFVPSNPSPNFDYSKIRVTATSRQFTYGGATINLSGTNVIREVPSVLTISSTSSTSAFSIGDYSVYIQNSSNLTNPGDTTNLKAKGSVSIAANSSYATFAMYSVPGSDSRWTYTDSGYYVYLVNNTTGAIRVSTYSQSFSNGSATIDLNSFTQVTSLKIANVSTLTSGTYSVYLHTNSSETNPGNSPTANGGAITIVAGTTDVIVALDSGNTTTNRWNPSSATCYVYLVGSGTKYKSSNVVMYYSTDRVKVIDSSILQSYN